MVLQLVTLGTATQPLRKVPYAGPIFEDRMRVISDNLFNYIRRCPELVSMLDTVVSDHFMGPVDFFNANGKPLGPTKSKQVRTFWEDSSLQNEALYGQAIDYFVDGSSFGWHTSVSGYLNSKQKEALAKLNKFNPSLGAYAMEQANMPRAVSYIAASTTEIKHDEFGELYYVQEAGGKRIRWDTDQIVHIKLMEWNGEIRGYSSLKALTREVLMLYMLKDNIMAQLSNGGSADNIISIKGATSQSRARFNRLRTALESFSHLKKSHGNLPIDADIEVHSLGRSLKDMEYRELAMFIISEFALALNLPTSRVPFLMTGAGGASNKGELSGNSEDSYQTKVNARRMQWENAWNKVFRKAGFTFKFRRDNLQDDVRETQAAVQRSAYVEGIQRSLKQAGKQLTLATHMALLSGSKMNIGVEDVEDIDFEELGERTMSMNPAMQGNMQAGKGGLMQPGNSQLKPGALTKDKSEAKEKTANNNGRYR